MNKIWKLTFSSLSLLLVLAVLAFVPTLDSKVHLVFCDVGQGDGILIYKQKTQIIVDAGPNQKILSCLGRHMPFWDRDIELVILTNPDLDHYGGLIDIIRKYNVEMIAVPDIGKSDLAFETLEKEVEARNIKVIKVSQGNKLKVEEMQFDVVWPIKEIVEILPDEDPNKKQVLGTNVTSHSPNEFSIVGQFSFGEFQALLTGDIEPPATDSVANSFNKPVELLKVPHHGSKNGLTQILVEKTRPKIAVISAGRKNRFGHPHKETLGILERLGVKTLGTYEKGEIEVITDGKTWVVK